MEIILASTSPYRRRLLERLQIPFQSLPPQVEECRLHGEEPAAMAQRLSLAKARAIAKNYPEALVIGSDQVASLGGDIMGKPGSHHAAVQQLRCSAGKHVVFHTGLAVIVSSQSFERFHVEPFSVYFRDVDDKSIENYLQREQPYDCAGSFKCEGLGIALFASLKGNDPTSLEGLPLIALTDMLAEAGVPVLGGMQR